MISTIGRFANQTTLHGFKELFHARSNCSRLIWMSIILIGGSMTALQMYYVIANYASTPTKTQISFLPPNVVPRFPPYIFRFKYFTEWVDLEKVKRYNFDYETFLYTMSYFHPVYSYSYINSTKAMLNLNDIMKTLSIIDIYDLGIALSLPTPVNVVSNISFYRFFDSQGRFHYMAKMNKQTPPEFPSPYSVIKLKSYADFETTQFCQNFQRLFNYSILEVYLNFRLSQADEKVDNSSIKSMLPVFFNAVGEKFTFVNVDSFYNDYEFYISGTLYDWIPMTDRPCDQKVDENFYADCLMICSKNYKLWKVTNCQIYYIPWNVTVHSNTAALENVCKFNENFIKNFSRSDSQYDFCIRECLSGCKKWHYVFHQVLTPSKISTNNNVTYLNGSLILNYNENDNIILVSILPSVDWNEALVSIGGLLGLWLGGSIVSFVQVLYLFCWTPLEKRLLNRGYISETSLQVYNVRKRSKVSFQLSNNKNRPYSLSAVDKSINLKMSTTGRIEKLQRDIKAVRQSSLQVYVNMKKLQYEVQQLNIVNKKY